MQPDFSQLRRTCAASAIRLSLSKRQLFPKLRLREMMSKESSRMYRFFCLALLAVFAAGLVAQTPSQSGVAHDPATDPAGLYSFAKEGESVQLTLEDGELSGYITRFGESESDKGQLIDQFFSKGSLKDNHLMFATKTIHGVWYEFDGTVETQPGKAPGAEGYRVLKGSLKQHALDANGNDKVRERTVEFKSFPEGVSRP
jgi:hypothetical protein